jgi:hypothetical protein
MALRFGTAERLRLEKIDNPVPENEVKRFAAKKMPGDFRQKLFALRRKMRLRGQREVRAYPRIQRNIQKLVDWRGMRPIATHQLFQQPAAQGVFKPFSAVSQQNVVS